MCLGEPTFNQRKRRVVGKPARPMEENNHVRGKKRTDLCSFPNGLYEVLLISLQ